MSLISGTDGADTLVGGAGADILQGFGGPDILSGGGGDDELFGGFGDVMIDGGAGIDLAHLDFSAAAGSMRYTAGVSSTTVAGVKIAGIEQIDFTGGASGDWITGGLYNDTIDGGGGSDWLKGGGGNDLLRGGSGYNILEGGAGNDTLIGGDSADQLSGGDGDDVLVGGIGDAPLDGGAGVDLGVLDFSSSHRAIDFSVAANLSGSVSLSGTAIRNFEMVDFKSGAFADTLSGGAYGDTLSGGGGDDRLVGGGGGDSLSGGDGDDSLEGGTGNDSLDGGAGFDTAHLSGDRADYHVSLSADGSVVLTDLHAGRDGTDVIDHVEQFAFADGTVSLNELVTGSANTPPVAVADAASVTQGSSAFIDVLANDSDSDLGDSLSVVSLDTTGLQGTAGLVDSHTVAYSPGIALKSLAAGETITEHFSYTVQDSYGATASADVAVTVTGVNDAPTALDDYVNANEDGQTSIAVLANDSDVDHGDHVALVGATQGLHGTTAQSAGGVVYTPGEDAQALNAGETLTDSFTYQVQDDAGLQSTATVRVLIHGANDAPEAQADFADVAASGTTRLDGLLLNDTDVDHGDHVTLSGVAATSEKGASISIDEGGHVVYDPGDVFSGLAAGDTEVDKFTYTVTDDHGATSTAEVDLSVTGGPVAEPDLIVPAFALDHEQTDDLAPTILEDASYVLGEPVSLVSIDSSRTLGSATFMNGEVHYTADDPSFAPLFGDISATTRFLYTVQTASGQLHTGAVEVVVGGVDDAPVAADDSLGLAAGASSTNLWSDLMANDADVDVYDSFSITGVDTNGTAGRVTFDAANHSLVYSADTPALGGLSPGQTFVDHFTYTLTDSGGLTSTANVAVTVTGNSAAAGWIFG